MARIAIGGFQHETNTFAPHRATLEAFEQAAAFPRVPRGQRIIDEMRDLNMPISGFMQAAMGAGHTLQPAVWAMATPSAHVTDHAFEHIVEMLLQDIAAEPVDAVYLCLHGAMVTESHQDGEGELLRRVRDLVGPEVPIVASLDLHSNTTTAMVENADALLAYRTYPHVDMARTGERAATLLDTMLESGRRPAKAFRKTDFLIALAWQCTLIEPAAGIYRRFDEIEAGPVQSISFTPGFPPADISECGPAVLAYADTQVDADNAVDQIFALVDGSRAGWNGTLYSPDDAIERAMAEYRDRPFVLADTQDNPGAGGTSDTVGLLESLVRNRADGAVFAMVYDPASARAAHAAGAGARMSLALGSVSGLEGHQPFDGEFTVEALSDGEFTGSGPMSDGRQFRLGPTAALRIGGVRVLITSARTQVLDLEMLRHIGIDPSAQKILAIKSSVHFRAAFAPIAQAVLVVVAPGANVADHHAIAYRNLRDGLALTPEG